MAQLKHLLEIERAVAEIAPGAATSYRHGRKHKTLRVEYAGRSRSFSVSCSPSQPDHAVRNTVHEVARFFNLTTRN